MHRYAHVPPICRSPRNQHFPKVNIHPMPVGHGGDSTRQPKKRAPRACAPPLPAESTTPMPTTDPRGRMAFHMAGNDAASDAPSRWVSRENDVRNMVSNTVLMLYCTTVYGATCRSVLPVNTHLQKLPRFELKLWCNFAASRWL